MYCMYFWLLVIQSSRDKRLRELKQRQRKRIASFNNVIKRRRRVWSAVLTAYISRRRVRSIWTKRRRTDLWFDVVHIWGNIDWLENVRMSKATFEYICSTLEPHLTKQSTRLRKPIPVRKRVLVALWRLATNIEYRTIGHLFGIGRSTACRLTNQFCEVAVKHLMSAHIKFPIGDDFRDVVEGFERRWGFPQVGGAIDGSHIPIVAPADHHTDYFNRKGWHSVIMQGVVDHRYRFMDVQVGWPGSVHDARVFSNSGLFIQGNSNNLFPKWFKQIDGVRVPIFLLGDPAYPLLPWLMKPFPRHANLTRSQKSYNYRQSRARMVVENAFGRLKARWRCLLKRYDCHISKLPDTIVTCCILHNICESHGEHFDDNWMTEVQIEENRMRVEQPDRNINVEAGSQTAQQIRNALVSWVETN